MVGNKQITKMKILVVFSRNLYFIEGAPSNRFRSIFEGLGKRNYAVHIIITGGYYNWTEYFFHKKYKYPKNIFIYYTGFPYQMRILKKIKYQSLQSQLIINKQKKIQSENIFDFGWITFGLGYNTYLESISLFKNSGAKMIQEVSEHPILFMSKTEFNRYLELILPQIDFIFVMTNNLLEFYKKHIDKNTNLCHIPMTVDLDRFSKSKSINKEDIYVISYVGLMNNGKDGVDILIKAFTLVSKKYKNVKLQLIGPYKPQADYFEQLNYIKNNDLEDKIQYLGEKSRDEIPQLLIDSDCLVLARPNSKQAQFGFPTKLGEYLATSNPVIVTSVGEIPFYLKNNVNAFVAKPNDINDFADKILNVFRNKSNAIIVGEKGYQVANKFFNTEIQSNAIDKVLKENSPK